MFLTLDDIVVNLDDVSMLIPLWEVVYKPAPQGRFGDPVMRREAGLYAKDYNNGLPPGSEERIAGTTFFMKTGERKDSKVPFDKVVELMKSGLNTLNT